ncbi:nitrate reductase molybdenum cofactor assembly chaperone [Actinomyces wuliandei]|uniref:nitrate reductase molybdenum cofactor assembly chaperone n=1 Tax=Actinomyces wuliandei TaxID=2057743 RepID=UPI000FDC9835|nr:nitrate reductase molybdenum cofactor assembly chaperone [Actinomyces wuliandei]
MAGTTGSAPFVRAPQVLQPPPVVALEESGRATVHMAASLLLDYPQEGALSQRLDAVEAALAASPEAVPQAVAAPLRRFVDTARRHSERTMAEHYVETFDRRRRCCLYLTYYAVGDTRHRGAAILAFKQAMAATGYEMAGTSGEELPDYLPVVLELSARSNDEVAQVLLSAHREGIEVLRSALVDIGSPYADLVEAVSMTLPPVDEATASRVQALVAAGPPAETVGVNVGVTEMLPFPTLPASYPAAGGPSLSHTPHPQHPSHPVPAAGPPGPQEAPIRQEALT